MKIRNVRLIIAAVATFSACAVYISRVNLSMAIIAMVEDQRPVTESNGNSNTHKAPLGTTTTTTTSTASPPTKEYHQPNTITRDTSSQPQYRDSYALLLPAVDRTNSSLASDSDLIEPDSHSNSTSLQPIHEPLGASSSFPATENSFKTPLIRQNKFHWDLTEQGLILSAFFYGYILFQIPGARIAEQDGAKWIIFGAVAGSAAVSLLFPLSTQLNSIYLLMSLRFIMGLCQSAFFPAAYALYCRWFPEHERTVLLGILFIGNNMGNISAYIMSSYLISSSQGWPSVFYLSGVVCLACSVLWFVIGSNGPQDNWLITDEERHYILSNMDNQSSEQSSISDDSLYTGLTTTTTTTTTTSDSMQPAKAPINNLSTNLAAKLPQTGATQPLDGGRKLAEKQLEAHSAASQQLDVPVHAGYQSHEPSWPKLLRSVPIWVLILSMYGNEWSQVIICYELPTYLNTALSFPIEQNGVINSFFQLCYAVVSPLMSLLGSWMLERHFCGMRKRHVRKLFQSISTFGQATCFLLIPLCGANRGLIIMFMFSAVMLKSCSNVGDIMVPGDLSPEYSGTIFAFANSVGNTAGFFAPILAGLFVENAYDRQQWTSFWLTTATIMASSGLIFLFFGKTKPQDYSLDESDLIARLELKEAKKSKKLQGPLSSKLNNNTSHRAATQQLAGRSREVEAGPL